MNDQRIHKSLGGERPLVTFALFAYNQEKYIREALDGVFAQTYSPLEIILSDDCSADGTYEVMADMVHKYRGAHKIILNRNDRNLGVCAHVNKVFDLARGQLIVVAAGDDVSFPNRTRRVVDVWKKTGASAIYCESNLIDDNGEITGYWKLPEGKAAPRRLNCVDRTVSVGFYGAGAAYDKNIFIRFGMLPVGPRNEDYNLSMRAALVGGVSYINEPLINYRSHGGNLSFWVRLKKARGAVEKMGVMAQNLDNLSANQACAVGYIDEVCGNDSPLSKRFRDSMLSTRIRSGVLYAITGLRREGIFTGLSMSRPKLVLKVFTESLALLHMLIREMTAKALKYLLLRLRRP